jgi:RimJ/RimL family protein N-acetyltransferase
MATITVNRLTEQDISGMHHEIRNSHGYLKELGWIENAMYLEFRNHYRQIMKMDDLMVFIVRVDGIVAGVVEVENRKEEHFIGYWLGVRFRGKGIITRSVQNIIDHDIPKDIYPLTARTPLNNEKSSGVLKRLNFFETNKDKEYIYFRKYR